MRNEGARQERALRTRQALIDAARHLFAQEGFSGTRLQDVAAAAGKTRGAFYSNFQDKEDLFFAIFEQDLERDYEYIRTVIGGYADRSQRLAAFLRYVAQVAGDRERMLLGLEFKLYTLRHPQGKARMLQLQDAIRRHGASVNDRLLIPGLSRAGTRKRQAQNAELAALIDGMALNHLFDPANLGEKRMLRLLQHAAPLILNA